MATLANSEYPDERAISSESALFAKTCLRNIQNICNFK